MTFQIAALTEILVLQIVKSTFYIVQSEQYYTGYPPCYRFETIFLCLLYQEVTFLKLFLYFCYF